MERFERSNRCWKTALSMQKSAEAIVAVFLVKGRINRSLKYDLERRNEQWVQKTKKAAHKEIARNVKGM